MIVLGNQIKNLALQIFDEVRITRRYLHAHPELSMQETGTAAYIASRLEQYQIDYSTGIAGNGIVATIRGNLPGEKVIALRADMDALAIQEKNNIDYCSVNQGVMHACGHDVHTANLLGTAWILSQLKDHFGGIIKLIFQPSEEKYPGGASLMIKEGVLTNPVPDMILAIHVCPELNVGEVGFRPGKYMASSDEIYITIVGKGGHAATPHLVVDPVIIAAQVLTGLQQIVSRNAKPATPTVLSFGRFMADGQTNVIPDKVELWGTFRTFDEEWRKKAHQLIERTANHIALSMGGSAEVTIASGYPFLHNHEELTIRLKEQSRHFLGTAMVKDLDIRMTAEDFSYFAGQIPACLFRLGIRNEEKGITSNLHSSTFNVDETSLITGTGLLAYLSISNLNML